MILTKNSLRYRTGILSTLLLMLPLLGACSEVKRIYEERTMSVYESETFNWGVQVGLSSMIITKGEEADNYLKDAQGQLLRRWFGYSNDLWGGGTPMGGVEEDNRLPKYLGVKYYEVVENKFYKLTDAVLPQQRIYDLFRQKKVEDFSGKVKPKYNQIKISILPKGLVWVFVDGLADVREVGLYQAKELFGMTVAQFNQFEGINGQKLGIPLTEQDWGRNEQIAYYRPELITKLQSGWAPNSEYYLNIARIRYPYQFSLSGNGRLTEFRATYGNFERSTVLPFSIEEEQKRLKAVPSSMKLYFNDKAGIRHAIRVNLYEKNTFWGEPDLSAIQKTFAKFFPNRKADDWLNISDQPIHEDEYATLEFHVSDNLKEITAFLIRGDQKEEIMLYPDENGSHLETLQPYTYSENDPSPNIDVIDRYLKGPQSSLRTKVRIGEVCPETGYWSCDYLSSAEGLFMRAGDRMPGQSAVARGDIPADTLWTLIKLGA